MTSPNRCRRGTILVFFIAAMAIVSVLVISLLKTQTEQATGISVAEAKLIADTMALSGIEIMATIDEKDVDSFLSKRTRVFAAPRQYAFNLLFGLDTASPGQYTPPQEYPPIRSVAPRYAQVDCPPNVQNNDIRLLNALVDLPAAVTLTVPGTNSSGNNGPAILPKANCRPRNTDVANYDNQDTPNSGSERYIKCLNHNTLGWYGPKNTAGTFPGSITGSGATPEKVPPPSFVIARDVNIAGTIPYRCFIYAWYAQVAGPTCYFMVSGRVRETLTSSGTEYLGDEVGVSATQLR